MLNIDELLIMHLLNNNNSVVIHQATRLSEAKKYFKNIKKELNNNLLIIKK